ncbi:DNA polymerase, partial [bacterium]|nr:DNA polymerase [bacterium]
MAAPSIRPRAAFDIETVGWDRFYCGALLFDGRMRTFRQDQEADLAAAILAVGEGDVLAHNGGRFDFLWLIDAWIRFGLWRDGMTINVAESGASIVSMRVRGPGLNLTFRDTYRMFPVSLARIGGKSEVGLACSMERAECAEQA